MSLLSSTSAGQNKLNFLNDKCVNYHNTLSNAKEISFKGYHIDNPVFAEHEIFINYRENNKNDAFIKNVLLSKLQKKNIQIPANTKLEVIAPRSISESMEHTLKLIIFGEFKGYTNYFFEMVSKPKEEFIKEISELKITPEMRSKLVDVYNYLDDFYTLNLTLPGDNKTYNLVSLTNEDKAELLSKATHSNEAFIKEVINQSNELKGFATKFSRSEVERATLFEAGDGSRKFIIKLVAGIAMLIGLDHYKDYLVNFLGPNTPMGKAANKITEFVGGSGDDCLGSYKDYFQDEITLGKKTATGILWASMIAGVGSSALAAKVGLSTLGGAILYGNASSGSSFFSNIATFVLMYKNFDKMVDKGIIKLPEEDRSGAKKFSTRLKTVWNNYQAYDAYFGKILGLIACTPAAIIAFKTGALAKGKVKPVVYATALTIVGSIESYVAMAVQLLRDNVRKAKMTTAKNIVVKENINSDQYNSRNYKINAKTQASKAVNNFKNFFKTFGGV